MLHTATDINKWAGDRATHPDFPYAPLDWAPEDALKIARDEGLQLGLAHWDVIRAVQSYYAHHDDDTVIGLRELHDALGEHFHLQGGLRFLYTLFPGGPVAQTCRLAGLKAPFMATDSSFGSVA